MTTHLFWNQPCLWTVVNESGQPSWDSYCYCGFGFFLTSTTVPAEKHDSSVRAHSLEVIGLWKIHPQPEWGTWCLTTGLALPSLLNFNDWYPMNPRGLSGHCLERRRSFLMLATHIQTHREHQLQGVLIETREVEQKWIANITFIV